MPKQEVGQRGCARKEHGSEVPGESLNELWDPGKSFTSFVFSVLTQRQSSVPNSKPFLHPELPGGSDEGASSWKIRRRVPKSGDSRMHTRMQTRATWGKYLHPSLLQLNLFPLTKKRNLLECETLL